jgi:hypothetical protein
MEYLGQKYSLQEVRKDANIWWEKIRKKSFKEKRISNI